MPTIKTDHVVVKNNALNEIRANNMTLQELRFFSIYLSKINPSDINTRVVRFPISDFQAIMNLVSPNIDHLQRVTNSLLRKVVNVPAENGGYTAFQIFKKCKVAADNYGEWYMEIDAHDDALPLMFELKEKFFKYKLWNALSLGSSNQLRMYEILKQYENIGYRIIQIDELRNLLGIDKNEYPRFGDFRIRVLEACQQALANHTDIKFTYAPHGKRGQRGRILYLKFTIEENKDYKNQLTLDTFIEENTPQNTVINIPITTDFVEAAEDEYANFPQNYVPPSRYEQRIDLFMDACDGEFSKEETAVFFDKMQKVLNDIEIGDDVKCFNFIKERFDYMAVMDQKIKISNRFKYMCSIMEIKI